MVGYYFEASKNFCEGCVHDYPSQRDHDCLMMPVQERIELLFKYMITKIDGEELHQSTLNRLKGENVIEEIIFVSQEELIQCEQWIELVKTLLKDFIEDF